MSLYQGCVYCAARALPQVTVPAVFSRLHVTLLPLYGNPDVFLNTNGVRPIAGGSASYGSSFYIGTDQIEVLYNDAVVRASCRVSQRPGASCTFNIGIYGADYSGYALIASIDGEPRGSCCQVAHPSYLSHPSPTQAASSHSSLAPPSSRTASPTWRASTRFPP